MQTTSHNPVEYMLRFWSDVYWQTFKETGKSIAFLGSAQNSGRAGCQIPGGGILILGLENFLVALLRNQWLPTD